MPWRSLRTTATTAWSRRRHRAGTTSDNQPASPHLHVINTQLSAFWTEQATNAQGRIYHWGEYQRKAGPLSSPFLPSLLLPLGEENSLPFSAPSPPFLLLMGGEGKIDFCWRSAPHRHHWGSAVSPHSGVWGAELQQKSILVHLAFTSDI